SSSVKDKGLKTPHSSPSPSAYKDKVCFICYGTGHIQSQCPNRTLVSFKDHVALINQVKVVKEEEDRTMALSNTEQRGRLQFEEIMEPGPDNNTFLLRMPLPPKFVPSPKHSKEDQVSPVSDDSSYSGVFQGKSMKHKHKKSQETDETALTVIQKPPFDIGDYVW
ncbi:Serine-aspartate repeat-containing protein F, partial [Bienertia sinuspersici]